MKQLVPELPKEGPSKFWKTKQKTLGLIEQLNMVEDPNGGFVRGRNLVLGPDSKSVIGGTHQSPPENSIDHSAERLPDLGRRHLLKFLSSTSGKFNHNKFSLENPKESQQLHLLTFDKPVHFISQTMSQDLTWHYYTGTCPIVIVEIFQDDKAISQDSEYSANKEFKDEDEQSQETQKETVVRNTTLGNDVNQVVKNELQVQHTIKKGTWFGCFLNLSTEASAKPELNEYPHALVGCHASPSEKETEFLALTEDLMSALKLKLPSELNFLIKE